MSLPTFRCKELFSQICLCLYKSEALHLELYFSPYLRSSDWNHEEKLTKKLTLQFHLLGLTLLSKKRWLAMDALGKQ